MKKFLFLLPFLAGGIAGCGDKHAEFKRSFVERCEQMATAEVTDNRIVPLIHDYCECSATQLAGKLSDEELNNIEDTDKNPALRDKLINITAPCLKELQAKSAKMAR